MTLAQRAQEFGPAARLLPLAIALAVAEIDPPQLSGLGWYDDAETGVAWLAGPLLFVAWLMSERGRSAGGVTLRGASAWLAGWLAWSVVSASLGTRPLESLVVTAMYVAVAALAYREAPNLGSAGFGALVVAGAGLSIGFGAIASLLGEVDLLSRDRLTLWWLESNHLALVAALAAACSAAVASGSRGRSRVAWAGLVVPFAVVVAATTSRTATLAVAAVGVRIALRHVARRWLMAVVLAFAVIGATALAVLDGASLADLTNREAAVPGAELRTVNGRTELWMVLAATGSEWATSGVGLGNDAEFTAELRLRGDVGFDPDHAHGLVPHVLLTTGVAGGILFVLGAAASLIVSVRRRDLVCQCIWIIVTTTGVSEPVIRISALGVFVIFGVGMLTSRSACHAA